MKKPYLNPKRAAITVEKAEAVLAWKRNYRSMEWWCRILGVSRNTLRSSIAAWTDPEGWQGRVQGRPNPLTVEQMIPLMEWWRSPKSQVDLARDLGLTFHQVAYIIRRGGAPWYIVERAAEEQGRTYHQQMRETRQARFQRLRQENSTRFRSWLKQEVPA